MKAMLLLVRSIHPMLIDMTNIEKIHDVMVLRMRMENSWRLISSALRPVSMTRS